MAGERLPTDRMLRRARWIVANPARYSVLVAGGLFLMGLIVLDGDVAFAGVMAIAAGVGNWLLWRPGGFQSRRWAERIAHADAQASDVDPGWDPPQVPPADDET